MAGQCARASRFDYTARMTILGVGLSSLLLCETFDDHIPLRTFKTPIRAEMSSAIFHQLVLVLVALLAGTGYSQDGCMPPTTSDLEAVITAIIRTGDSATEPEITVSNFNVVCRAFAQQQDRLRIVSVVVEYTCTNNNNCPSGGTAVEQIESGCDSGSWTNTVFGSSEPSEIRSQSPVATLSTTARDNCSVCLSTQLAGGQGITTDTVTHCVGE